VSDLIAEGERFAEVLSEVVNGTVGRNVQFIVTPLEGPDDFAWVQPIGSSPGRPELVPIVAGSLSRCPWPCETPRWWPGKVLAVVSR
jgi:hypothetical protein